MAQEIKSVADLVTIIRDSKYMERSHSHVRIWFRGHADVKWELNPGVYRPDFKAQNENDRLSLERHLSQDFQAFAAPRLTGRETDAELYFLQQHYGMPTRLMDWTSNPLIALWFAVNDTEHWPQENRKGKDEEGNDCEQIRPGSDGEIFMMDAYAMKNTGKDDYGIATSRHSDFLKALTPIFDWHSASEFPRFIIPVRPSHIDWRIRQQQGFFTFHAPDTFGDNLKNISPTKSILTEKDNESLQRYSISKDCKNSINDELTLMGINAFHVYGDLPNLSNALRDAYLNRWHK